VNRPDSRHGERRPEGFDARAVERSAPCETLDRARDRTGRAEHREMARPGDEVEGCV
jgi:hypothetical protein